MRSPGLTVLPGRTSLVMMSELELGPERRGAAIVVDCTASTVPLSRTARTKSRRATVRVCWPLPVSGCPSPDGWRAYRKTTAPARTTVVVSTATRRTTFGLESKPPRVISLSDANEPQRVGRLGLFPRTARITDEGNTIHRLRTHRRRLSDNRKGWLTCRLPPARRETLSNGNCERCGQRNSQRGATSDAHV